MPQKWTGDEMKTISKAKKEKWSGHVYAILVCKQGKALYPEASPSLNSLSRPHILSFSNPAAIPVCKYYKS